MIWSQAYENFPNSIIKYIQGDFNARLHYREQEESHALGKFIPGRRSLYANSAHENTRENRELFMQFVIANDMVVSNTKFERENKNLFNENGVM